MSKHPAPRTRSLLWRAVGFGLAAGALVLTGGVAASIDDANHVVGTAHAEPVTYDYAYSCWAEKVTERLEDVEVICGDAGDRPRTDTADLGEVIYPMADPLDGGREPWRVTMTGPVPA